MRPRVDGLIIRDAGRQAVFLPAVWESLEQPEAFLQHLKVKAGLRADHWSTRFRAWRFVAEETSTDVLSEPAAVWSRVAN